MHFPAVSEYSQNCKNIKKSSSLYSWSPINRVLLRLHVSILWWCTSLNIELVKGAFVFLLTPRQLWFSSGLIKPSDVMFVFCCCFSERSAVKMESDLFDLQQSFQSSMQSASTGLPVGTAWAGKPFFPFAPFFLSSSTNTVAIDFGSACYPSLVAVVWLWSPPLPLLFTLVSLSFFSSSFLSLSSLFFSSLCLHRSFHLYWSWRWFHAKP